MEKDSEHSPQARCIPPEVSRAILGISWRNHVISEEVPGQ